MSTQTRPAVSEEIWAAMDPLFRRIIELPFLTELRAGTLPRETFARFTIQDATYLNDYGRCLAVCAARVGNPDDLITFSEAAGRVIQVERTMHAEFMSELGVTPEEIRGAEQIPTLRAYTSWVKQLCGMGERHEAVAGVLPCFWIYREVGRHLGEVGGSSDPLYQRWIDKYSGEAFAAATQAAIDACDRAGEKLGPEGRQAMVHAAWMSTRYELLFWDAVYRDEQWPV
jgi:thiaminase/transcriptional activator TenA